MVVLIELYYLNMWNNLLKLSDNCSRITTTAFPSKMKQYNQRGSAVVLYISTTVIQSYDAGK